MWKYLDKDENKKFILSLDLVPGNRSNDDKLKILYAISNHPEKYYEKKLTYGQFFKIKLVDNLYYLYKTLLKTY